MKPLSIRDLFAVTLLVAVHIATCKFAVAFRHSALTSIVILMPTAITIWTQRRISCSFTAGSVLHYCITVVWAFFFGVTYSFFYIRAPRDFFEKDSVGMEYPFTYGIFSAEIWAVLGIVTSLLYGGVGYTVVTWIQRGSDVELTPESNTKPDEPNVGPETSKDSLGDG